MGKHMVWGTVLHKHYYTIIDFNELDITIYLPKKVIIHQGRSAKVNITFKGRLFLCLAKLKSITVLLYNFALKNGTFATFNFGVRDILNLQSKTS